MSGPGENKWRGGPSRQSSQRHSNNGNRGGPRNDNTSPAASGPAQDQHVPVRGFNAAEAKSLLKRGPEESKATFYKPAGKDNNQRSGGSPWGSKQNTMANGKDFFLELRKQIASLQRTGPPVGG
ncbi:uncharacterized protein N7477_007820 [Penicillium maclennaniae]|uniref:uncharacterized protein n=1 Tax=Penicillium maclennaniae TaxID=1343394 RepID=UPI00253FCE17|nr:uncharacterized protein N7477_007820 [Penicillium maclennaniae]KAJ5665372.1 hypothetical protein N7477_007820 [Penicillium maclennaniae]